MTFSQKLREARLREGLTQTELAEKTGVTLRSIQNYEAGQKPRSEKTLITLAAVLKLSITDFIRRPTIRQYELDAEIRAELEEKHRNEQMAELNALAQSFRGIAAEGLLSEEEISRYVGTVYDIYYDLHLGKDLGEKEYRVEFSKTET